MKTLYDISWQVDEPTYREDSALSYSTLARFNKTGFNGLSHLYDKIESPSLTFGSAVDALITGGQKEFDENFFVADFPKMKDSIVLITNELFNLYSTQYRTLEDIPNENIISLTETSEFQLNWKPETRAKVIKESGSTYYSIKYAAQSKTIISVETKNQIDATVRALKESPATKWYFMQNDVFDESIQRFYQLKFKASFGKVTYRCMADLIIVDHTNKIIYPVDLKTSGHKEWEFFNSFIQWQYQIQARLYWRIIRKNLDNSEYADYKLADYRFIVVNKETLTPLVWEFSDTMAKGSLYYGKQKQIECRDPFDIGEELYSYLSTTHTVPIGIEKNAINYLDKYLDEL